MVTIVCRKSPEILKLNRCMTTSDTDTEQKAKKYTLEDVAKHCDFSSCWLVIQNRVYDLTDFLREHPGGSDVILENAGTDATVPFTDKGHSSDAVELMSKYVIGDLTEEDRRKF